VKELVVERKGMPAVVQGASGSQVLVEKHYGELLAAQLLQGVALPAKLGHGSKRDEVHGDGAAVADDDVLNVVPVLLVQREHWRRLQQHSASEREKVGLANRQELDARHETRDLGALLRLYCYILDHLGR